MQGVGYRYFAQRAASELGVCGYARNLEDGRVEVYAVGAPEALRELSGFLWQGPRFSSVRGVEEQEAEIRRFESFRIEH